MHNSKLTCFNVLNIDLVSYQNSSLYLSWLSASYKHTSPRGTLLQYSVQRSMD